MTEIKIISCNVRGIGETRKRQEIFHLLHNKKVDIAFLQETYSSKI